MWPYCASPDGGGNSEGQLYPKVDAEDVQQVGSMRDGAVDGLARKASNIVGDWQDKADDGPVIRLGRGGRRQCRRGSGGNASLRWLCRATTQVKGARHGCRRSSRVRQIAFAAALRTRQCSSRRAGETAGIGEAGRRRRDGKDGERLACACGACSVQRERRGCQKKLTRSDRTGDTEHAQHHLFAEARSGRVRDNGLTERALRPLLRPLSAAPRSPREA